MTASVMSMRSSSAVNRGISLVLAPDLDLPQHHAVRMIEGGQQVTAVLAAVAGAA